MNDNSKFPGVYIHPTAEVSDDAVIYRGTSIWNQVQIRERTKIGGKCNFGKDVYIDFDVSIGNNVKVQNGVSIYHGVVIEDDVFLGPHMTFTNDLFPRAWIADFELFYTTVKKGASIGAHATIVCGITIGEYAMVGAGSVVTKDVPNFGLVVGSPARLIGFVGKSGQKLDEVVEKNDEFVVLRSSKNEEQEKISLELFNSITKK